MRWGGLLVFALALVTFAGAALCGWTNWDDPLYVLENPRVLDTSFGALLRLWSFEDAHMGMFIEYFPLRDSVYWAVHRAFGVHPAPYHIVNMLLHGMCSALVVALGGRLGFSPLASLLAGSVFAVHPVHCESVVWISGLKDPLFTCLFLSSVLCYEPDGNGKRKYLASFVLFVLSLLCKSIGFLLPVLLFALAWRRRVLTRGSLLALLPFVVISLMFLVNFIAIGHSNSVILDHSSDGAVFEFITSLWCFVLYLSMQILPINLYILHIINPVVKLDDIRGAASLLICGCLAVGMLGLWVRHRTFAVLALWFVLFLLPVLNIIPIPILVAERYLYLPSVAYSLAVGAALGQLAMRSRALGTLAALVVLVGLGARTVWRNEDWRGGSVSLWQGVVSQPTAAMVDSPWLQLGAALLEEGRIAEGEQALLRAMAIQDSKRVLYAALQHRRGSVHLQLGNAYLQAKRFDLAREHLNDAVGFNPRSALAWNSLSMAEAESGDAKRAEHAANMAVQIDGSLASARFNRGLARLDLGLLDEAIVDLAQAVDDDSRWCRKLSLWQLAVGEIPVAARIRAEVAPRCP